MKKQIQEILEKAKEQFVFEDENGHTLVDETGDSLIDGLEDILIEVLGE